MAVWIPDDRSSRDHSPSSPLTPLSPSSLPQWLRSGTPKPGSFFNPRRKTYAVICGVLVLGWWATIYLGPGDEYITTAYDSTSGEVLREPSNYGLAEDKATTTGILGYDDDVPMSASNDNYRKPSVKGALSDLHHAVSDKLQGWSPYKAKPVGYESAGPGHNRTASSTPSHQSSSTPAEEHGEDVVDGVKDRLGARTRIGKCTIVFNGNSAWERALRTHEEHDKLHGYRLHVLRQQLMDDVWSKPAYILSLLLRELAKPESERLEWIMWVDADTIILNPRIPIEVFLPPPDFEDVHLVYTNDWNGLNNGIFPIKVNRWAADLFSAIMSYRYYRPDAPLQFRDQSAMDALLHEPKFAKHIAAVPQRWFNAYQGEHNETLAPFQIRRGDLLVHFAGVPGRDERMAYWLDRAEQHLDDWEMPLKSTSYPQEARTYWEEQRVSRKAREQFTTETRLKAIGLLTTTDHHLNQFGNRLPEDQRTAIQTARESLKNTVDSQTWQDELSNLTEQMKLVESASQPLRKIIEALHKTLLSSAHEAIFAGERDLFEQHFSLDSNNANNLNDGNANEYDSDLRRISETMKVLKDLVMAPQAGWETSGLQAAIDGVTGARAALATRLARVQAEKETERQKAQLEEAAAAAGEKEMGLLAEDQVEGGDGKGKGEGDWELVSDYIDSAPAGTGIGTSVTVTPGVTVVGATVIA
ncbi:hypothetical protein LTR62_001265 [Meristemomyces frigidus]|uniref:Glycosyltransferase family 34 protein n=1 Tax=Meristemomyces frigidus TaxID=1508187 RepID=A0AAN7YL71_9PEZI|nr:hypothetical protein LTR62_001265 [Meristemomyces frigidus]